MSGDSWTNSIDVGPAKADVEAYLQRSVWLMPPSMTADEIEAKFCKDGVCVLPPPWLRTRPTERDWKPVDDARRSGVCTHWDARRGFGFITPSPMAISDERIRVFVHRSDILSEDGRRFLRVGENIEFSTATNRLNGKTKATAVSTVASEEDLDAIFEELFGSSASSSLDYTDFAA